MKKLVVAIALSLLVIRPVFAQTPASGSGTTSDPKLESLKDRLATKVAELRQLTKRAIAGTVTAVSVSTFTVETKTSEVKIEITDEIKVVQFLKGKRTTLGTDDIAKGDMVTVFGTYDSSLDLLQAKVVFIEPVNQTTRLSGTITDKDETGFTLTVQTPEKQTYTIDIEKTTATLAWTADGGVVKGGFTKIAVGDTVHILGLAVAKQTNRISATRVLDIGNPTGATPTLTATPEPTATPTTKPTGKVTPTPTAKTTVKPTPTP